MDDFFFGNIDASKSQFEQVYELLTSQIYNFKT